MSENQHLPRKAPAKSGVLRQRRLLPQDTGAGPLEFSERRRVLVVDHSPPARRMLREIITELGHEVLEASSTSQAFCVTSREAVDMIIADLLVPDLGGTGFCYVLRSQLQTHAIPVFLLANTFDPEQEVTAIASGADDFLARPFSRSVLRARVQSALRKRTLLESTDQAETILFSLAQAVEARDPAVGQHCQRLALISSTLGAALGLPADQLVTLQRGGFLHDVGKISIPDNILFKPGPLTAEEWVIMKEHTIRGERICYGMKALEPVLSIVRSHHERWDGSGYPDGLRGEDIPLLARVLQIADIFDALTTARPYKRAYTSEYAMQVLREEVKTGWRDPRLVEAFSDISRLFRTEEFPSNSSLLALASSLGDKSGWQVSGHSPSIPASSMPSDAWFMSEAM
jgi:putative two-component system response regulator